MTDLATLAAIIDEHFERRADLNAKNTPPALRHAIEECIELLDSGQARVAEKKNGQWTVNQWLKKAVLLYFRTHDNAVIDAGYTRFFDKVPLKYAARSQADDGESLRASGARVVPPAVARRGSYIAPNVVLMPSYVNIGAYVDSGAMVDTWATVGLLRADRQERAPLRRRRHRRSARAPASRAHHHRGQLLHRRALGSRRRCDRRGRLGDLDGRVHRPEHQDL